VEVVIVLVFVSLVLVTGAVVMFIMRVYGGDFEHSERLSLLPLDDDGGRTAGSAAAKDARGDEENGGER